MVERMPRGIGSRCGVNCIWSEVRCSCSSSSPVWRWPKTEYAERLSAACMKCVFADGDLPAPLTPLLESQMMPCCTLTRPAASRGANARMIEVA